MRTGFKLFQSIHIYIYIYLLCRISFQGPWERVNPWLFQGITVEFQVSFRFHSGSIPFWFHFGSIQDFRVRSDSIGDPFRFIHDFRVSAGSIWDLRLHSGSIWDLRLHSGSQDPFRIHSGSQDPFRIHSGSQAPFRIHLGSQAPFRIWESRWDPFRVHSGSVKVSFRIHSGFEGPIRIHSGSIRDLRLHSGSIQGPCCLSLTVPPTYRMVWEQVSNFFNLSIYIYKYIHYVDSASRVCRRESTLDSPRELP